MLNSRRMILLAVGLVVTLARAGAPGQSTDSRSKVLIRTPKPYAPLVERIESLGGRVTNQYKYIDAIAADLPDNALTALGDTVGPAGIMKDEEIDIPRNVDSVRLRNLGSTHGPTQVEASGVTTLSARGVQAVASVSPNGYVLNNIIANVSTLHGSGITGAGVIVAVIDSGIRPGFPHISLDGSVIGCEDFVGDAFGCSNTANDGHGTFVAGMISANAVFTFPSTNGFRKAVLAECPGCFVDPPTYTKIPMIGTAPLSSIYALRIFDPTLGTTPTSRIIAAIERVIELREKFDAGLPGGVNIQVCQMSLGGRTVFAGRSLMDVEVDVLLEKGIVPVVAAGNNGPSSLTIASPGSSRSALTVGAASLAHNERIFQSLFLGPVYGPLFRPFPGAQTANFSSRGPNADGHSDPDVLSNGVGCYSQGYGSPNEITLGSGTSFSTPSVAGVVALLRQKYPAATARQIRNAIIASANPGLLSDGSTALDQGAGYVDGAAAATLLGSGGVSDTLQALPNSNKSVKVNVEQGSFLRVKDGALLEHADNLKPGQRHEILYRVQPNTRQVIITLANVTPALPPAQQNQLFGDDILFTVHSAKTSAIGYGDYYFWDFTLGRTVVVNDPETGLMRITVNGDTSNAGNISADVSILSLTEPIPLFSAQGKIADRRFITYLVSIPPGVSVADFQLAWREDWGSYPSSDVNLILVDPSGVPNFAGATQRNPETVSIKNPAPGTWRVIVHGVEIYGGTDKFELRASLDGKVIR